MGAVYTIEKSLWYALILCQFAMAAALLFRGMWRQYPALWIYSLLVFGRSLLILSFGFRFWFRSEPFIWLGQCAVLHEASRALGREYSRLGQLGRMVAILGGGAAFCVGVLSYSPALSLVPKFMVAERMATGAQLAFLASVILAFRIVPTLVRPNVARLTAVLAAYVSIEVARYWIATDLMGIHLSNIAGMALEGSCYLAWGVLLKQAGERIERPPLASSGEIDALRQRNAGMIDFARKLGR